MPTHSDTLAVRKRHFYDKLIVICQIILTRREHTLIFYAFFSFSVNNDLSLKLTNDKNQVEKIAIPKNK